MSEEEETLRDIILNFKEVIASALFSGMILDMCRSAPLKAEDIHREQLKAWGKEYSVCTRTRLPHRINFRVFFEEESFHTSITPYVSPNPRMSMYVHSCLVKWRNEVCSQLHYPRLSAKQASYDTQRYWEKYTDQRWVNNAREGGIEFNQRTIERYYLNTGVQLPGVSEMRQKWYKSGTTPRTYFAQGGTHFHRSKYTQGMFLSLVDMLGPTNHVSRLNPARILMDNPDDYLRIYDLSSFTSNCHEQSKFLHHLALFCSGHNVSLVDAREGVIVKDLGDLISEYNQVCNEFPLFSIERFDKNDDLNPISHSNASFLGIYGNLATCTFLHGAVVLQAFDSPSSLNVAGDDGHFKERPGFEDIATDLIRSIGVVERTKEFDSREEGAVCLKRGLYQQDLRIYQKLMIIWPSFHTLGSLLGFRSPQFSPFDKDLSRDDLRDMVGNEILRFLSHLYYAKVESNLDIIIQFLHAYYDATNFPQYGTLPQCGGRYLCPVLPTSPEDILNEHPLDKLIRSSYNGSAMVTVSFDPNVEFDEASSMGYDLGYTWRGEMTRHLTYLQKLGFLQSSKLKQYVWGDDGLQRLIEDFDPFRVPMYEFEIIDDIPFYLRF